MEGIDREEILDRSIHELSTPGHSAQRRILAGGTGHVQTQKQRHVELSHDVSSMPGPSSQLIRPQGQTTPNLGRVEFIAYHYCGSYWESHIGHAKTSEG